MIDGMALAAAIQADAGHHPVGFSLLGLGTFLAVLLHKPLDALSITSTMAAAGWTKRNQFFANLGFALMCPTGAALFASGIHVASGQSQIVGLALAFSGGVFLCISLADLLPEVTFHSHDRLALTAALLLGVVLAWGIGFLEPAHLHEDHDHGHDHGHSHAELHPGADQLNAIR
jgi:zinc and cadmium transporter